MPSKRSTSRKIDVAKVLHELIQKKQQKLKWPRWKGLFRIEKQAKWEMNMVNYWIKAAKFKIFKKLMKMEKSFKNVIETERNKLSTIMEENEKKFIHTAKLEATIKKSKNWNNQIAGR